MQSLLFPVVGTGDMPTNTGPIRTSTDMVAGSSTVSRYFNDTLVIPHRYLADSINVDHI